jgi:molybdopterin-binding protein
MTISARNNIRGKIKEIKKDQVMAEVIIEITKGVDIVSAITSNSVERLGLKVGKEVGVVIKATSVMIDA